MRHSGRATYGSPSTRFRRLQVYPPQLYQGASKMPHMKANGCEPTRTPRIGLPVGLKERIAVALALQPLFQWTPSR